MTLGLDETLLAHADLNDEEWRFVALRKGIGVSSDSLIEMAITKAEFPDWLPADQGDLGRCEMTYKYAPPRLRRRMKVGIELGRRAASTPGLYCRTCDTFGHSGTIANECERCAPEVFSADRARTAEWFAAIRERKGANTTSSSGTQS